jgi:DNA modification methylase
VQSRHVRAPAQFAEVVKVAKTAAPLKVARRTLPLSDLKPYPGNARRHDLAAITASLEHHGQYRPLVVQASKMRVLAGNGTLAAARELGWKKVRCELIEVDDDQARRIVLVDNRTNDLAGYEDELLADLLQPLASDPSGTGFDEAALADLLESGDADGLGDPDDVPEPPAKPTTKPGDLYVLGEHRLLCGDCREGSDVGRLLDRKINVAVTSPPYADRREYDTQSPFRPIAPDAYVEWFEPVQAIIAQHLADDGSWFLNIKAGVTPDGLDTELYVIDLVVAHVRRWGWHFATEFCWERNGVPKAVTRRFKNQFEPVYQFTRGDWKMRPQAVRHASDNVPVAGGPGVGDTGWANDQGGNGPMFGKAKRRKHGVRAHGDEPGMAYPGNRLPTFTATHTATGHTAAFPVGLPDFFIRAYSDPNDAIYDPFMGSGSTIMAAERSERAGYGMEISPAYCDVIVKRWEDFTGRKAKRER